MKLINIVYGFVVILTAIIVCNLVNNNYISKNCYLYDSVNLYPNLSCNESAESLEFVDYYETYNDVKAYIGYSPLKEYISNGNQYLIVSEGLDLFDERIVCYKYVNKTKKLYKIEGQYCSVSTAFFYDGDWYDNSFIFDIMTTNTDGHYIPQDNKSEAIGDIYYGVWFGDEIKNISIKKGDFEYSFLGNLKKYGNVYFFTYELKDSKKILSQVIKSDENGDAYYESKDVANLLGVKCKMTIDWRIVTYIIVTLLLTTIAALVLIKTLKINVIDGVIIKKVLLWILSIALCSVVAVLIRYYIANPRLYFGQYGIAEVIKNITGQSIPNPKNACP